MKFISRKIILANTNVPRKPRVVVPASAGEGLDKYQAQNLKLPSGGNVRGTPIPWHHESIPDHVYHVTPKTKEVLDSGMLLAGGKGGLGGDNRDQHVSLTTSPLVAKGLKRDMMGMANLAKNTPDHPGYDDPEKLEQWHRQFLPALREQSNKEGWDFDPQKIGNFPDESGPYKLRYGLQDWMNHYYQHRDSWADKQAGGYGKPHEFKNPLFYDLNKPETMKQWREVDPTNVGIIKIPKEHLNTGSLMTDFDLGRNHLDEVRHYGDIPLHKVDNR